MLHWGELCYCTWPACKTVALFDLVNDIKQPFLFSRDSDLRNSSVSPLVCLLVSQSPICLNSLTSPLAISSYLQLSLAISSYLQLSLAISSYLQLSLAIFSYLQLSLTISTIFSYLQLIQAICHRSISCILLVFLSLSSLSLQSLSVVSRKGSRL